MTDIARYRSIDPRITIHNWLRSRDIVEFLGLWEELHNPDFKRVEFDTFKTDAGTNGLSPYSEIDADNRVTEICDTLSIGASVQNILLTATELGYGTLWIANTFFAYDELVNFIDIKGQLVGAISLGVPNEVPNQRPRKEFEDVVEFK